MLKNILAHFGKAKVNFKTSYLMTGSPDLDAKIPEVKRFLKDLKKDQDFQKLVRKASNVEIAASHCYKANGQNFRIGIANQKDIIWLNWIFFKADSLKNPEEKTMVKQDVLEMIGKFIKS